MKYLVIFLTPNGLRFLRIDFGESSTTMLTLDTPFIVVGLIDVTICAVNAYTVTDAPEVSPESSQNVTDFQRFYSSLWQSAGSPGSMQYLANYPPRVQDFIPAFTNVCLNR